MKWNFYIGWKVSHRQVLHINKAWVLHIKQHPNWIKNVHFWVKAKTSLFCRFMVRLENGGSSNVALMNSKRYFKQHFPSLPLWNNTPAAWTDALLLYIVQRGFISLNRCILLLSFQLGHIWERHRALRMNNRPHAHYINEMFACTGGKKGLFGCASREKCCI